MKITKLTPEIVKNKVVILRVDFNVPLKDGNISENTRVLESLSTINFLIKHKAKQIHILSHLGRPKDEFDPKFSLKIVHQELEKLLNQKVAFRDTLVASKDLIQLHENIRFYSGEKKNDPDFIKTLLNLGGEIYINDGFAVSHRAHASVVGVGNYLPSYPGFLLEKEIQHLSPFLSDQKIKGLTVIIGGAKIETKAKILEHFCSTAENIILGGALANTFLAAKGINVQESLYEESEISTAKNVFLKAEKKKTQIHLPSDVIVAEDIKSKETKLCKIKEIPKNMSIFDIGEKSIADFSNLIKQSQTIIWNGPLGCFEFPPFQNGTRNILKTIASQKSTRTILGGGDTLDAIKKFSVEKEAFTHVSTGGGAMLEYLEGKELPGIEILKSY